MSFEYTSVTFTTKGFFGGGKLDVEAMTERLNQFGRDGWELVSCLPVAMSYGQTREVIAVLKRRR